MAATAPSRAAASAQKFLAIDTIRDGVAILKGGRGLRAILMVSSLNFALKSEEEQEALIYQYENFLNSLDFGIQFVIQSRRLNIEPYLATLATRQREETNDLIKVQISEYTEFIKSFVELSQIVSKTFYVVVTFQPSVAERTGGLLAPLKKLFSSGASPAAGAGDEFALYRNQLAQRVEAVTLGLRRLGLRVVELGTEELVELYYGLYNPTESQRLPAKRSQDGT